MPYIVYGTMMSDFVYSLTLRAHTHCKHSMVVCRAMLGELDLDHVWHGVQVVM